MSTRRRILYAALAVLVGTLAGGWIVAARFATRDIVGEATAEYVPRDPIAIEPLTSATTRRPDRIAWGLWGAGAQRLRVSPHAHQPPYRARWSFHAESLIEFAPVVGHATVYFANNTGTLFAVRARDGKLRWKYESGRVQAAAPALHDRTVYHAFMYRSEVGKGDPTGEIVAITALTGKVRWRREIAPSESSPLIRDGVVIVGDWSGRVHALDAVTGETRWEFRAGGAVKSAVAAMGDRLFFGSYDSRVYCLDASTGRLIWRASAQERLGVTGRFYSTPAVAYGRVYIGATDGKVYAFDASTGKLRWSRSTGSYVYGSPAVWKGRVYVGSWDRTFYALDAATGEVAWKFAAGGAISGSATVVDGLVYVSTLNGVTVGLDAATGEERWRFGDGAYAGVVADTKKLYVVGRGRLYAFRSVVRPAIPMVAATGSGSEAADPAAGSASAGADSEAPDPAASVVP